MKYAKSQIDNEGCNCVNCRLERMESAIGKMNESVKVILDGGNAIPGMPKSGNRINKK